MSSSMAVRWEHGFPMARTHLRKLLLSGGQFQTAAGETLPGYLHPIIGMLPHLAASELTLALAHSLLASLRLPCPRDAGTSMKDGIGGRCSN